MGKNYIIVCLTESTEPRIFTLSEQEIGSLKVNVLLYIVYLKKTSFISFGKSLSTKVPTCTYKIKKKNGSKINFLKLICYSCWCQHIVLLWILKEINVKCFIDSILSLVFTILKIRLVIFLIRFLTYLRACKFYFKKNIFFLIFILIREHFILMR